MWLQTDHVQPAALHVRDSEQLITAGHSDRLAVRINGLKHDQKSELLIHYFDPVTTEIDCLHYVSHDS